MFGVIIVIASLITTMLAANVASAVREQIYTHRTSRRKLKASGSPASNRKLLIVLFPITLYILIGTLLLLLLTLLEALTKPLRDYSARDEEPPFEVIVWHELDMFLTLFFPIVWPMLAIIVGVIFIDALVRAIFTMIVRLLEGVFSFLRQFLRRFLRRIWVVIIHALRDMLDWLADQLRVVWETVVGFTRWVMEQINASLRTIWDTINDTLRL